MICHRGHHTRMDEAVLLPVVLMKHHV